MFSPQTHRLIYIAGLCGLAFGMMVGTVPTSVPQIALMGNWLLEGRFRKKWASLRSNPIFWMLSSVFLIHLAGLLYTEDLSAGGDDVRTKMPLMFLPMLIFSSGALTRRELRLVLFFFILGCVASTAWSLLYTYLLHPGEGLRNASRFMSHIRLGLFLNMGIATCVWFMRGERRTGILFLFAACACYFFACMYLLGLFSGLLNFFLLLSVACLVLLYRKKGWYRFASLLAFLSLVTIPLLYLRHAAGDQLRVKRSEVNLPKKASASGNLYIHFDRGGQKENGYYVLMNIQLEELQRAWKRDFPADSFSYDARHNLGRYEVLVRYMAGKGLMKDSAGYASLTGRDKALIASGVTNHLYPEWSLIRRRAYELVNEYDEFVNNRHVSGHSMSMRLYFWKAAAINIAQRPLFGAGTGDVAGVMKEVYVNQRMPLEREWFKRPHNQFLTVGVALGICGLAVFVASLLYPLFRSGKPGGLYGLFFALAVVSFMFEDTLETQAGLTFFAFFNTLLLSPAAPGERATRAA